jgi:hypothetical protein
MKNQNETIASPLEFAQERLKWAKEKHAKAILPEHKLDLFTAVESWSAIVCELQAGEHP